MAATDVLSQLRQGKLAGATRLDLNAGLTEFPREIFDLADSLEILNLSQNRLCDLPSDLYKLRKLRILFCSENRFTHLPGVLGKCLNLTMVGFKSNQINHLDEASLPVSLRWLILTDNRICRLPSSIGKCSGLQKLMLSGNELEYLPDEMLACGNLQLLRLSSNRLSALPSWLLTLPRLTWLAFSDNPFSAIDLTQRITGKIDWADLELHERLGEGASGTIYKAQWYSCENLQRRLVAVKVFKGAVTSDGLPSTEMENSIAAGNHENLIPVLGRIVNHPEGKLGLVMPLVDPDFVNLASPPNFDSCTRDVYLGDQRFSLAFILRLLTGVACAAAHLHGFGMVHGDLYGHNVLHNSHGDCLLGDFGASSLYTSDASFTAIALQAIEVRAFGCLMEELLDRCVVADDEGETVASLWVLQARCVSPELSKRPSFLEIQSELPRAF